VRLLICEYSEEASWGFLDLMGYSKFNWTSNLGKRIEALKHVYVKAEASVPFLLFLASAVGTFVGNPPRHLE